MSNRREPTVPETRRRRASTVAQSERIMAMSRHLALTRSVLADALAQATPVQLDFIERWFQAGPDSRQAARRTRLPGTAGFPAGKTLDGHDWSNLTMPADWDRARLESLDSIDRHEDLVLYGSVGTGKTHLAIALGQAACRHDVPTRFFTTASLVMRLRRAKQDNRLDKELAAIGKARPVILDELGHIPIDEEGSRLLSPDHLRQPRRQGASSTTANIEFSGRGRVSGDPNTTRRSSIDRTVHHGRIIRFQGDSYRSRHALMTR
ncbi:ATP-binding protein [Bifidobacterium pullorum subsp. saeculare]|uniref:ATP-binding protein n=1 Tax=Bifidobacterium pullorum subsp. saeculare TaxID=78257 RepID=A0A938X1C2_9BIFI|nr:ATP-binding protein [Bifidobacterium pullorum]MBM6700467.1 ATP-binding protein [Bifidobacterium pullorum subsp. saeculare]